ncbi:MAG: hypothetical protein ACJ73L_12430 [Actinomycetes bacterium]
MSTAPKDMPREELLARLVEVTSERDALARDLNREQVLNEDLQHELADLRMFRLRMGELVHWTFGGHASDDQIIGAVKTWLAFFRQVAALCPHAAIPGTMLDWIRIVKGKAAEWDRTVF